MLLLTVTFLSFLLSAGFLDAAPVASTTPVIKAKSGPISGQLIQIPSSQGDSYQFVGIPFAEPPVGPRRFKKPSPVKPWTKTLDATKVPSSCVQQAGAPTFQMSLQSPLIGSEDCLYLNMWVPKWAVEAMATNGSLNGKPLLSTYIFIHGGGFWGGSGSYYNGSILAGYNDIIVVDIQYRLGSLGFAYYGTNDMPGNMGLWDQLEAMKWVYENIGAFGGNNSAITIGGQSAGGASVTFHMLSPKSRKYFQRAIVESGAATAPWATHSKQTAKNVTDLMLKNVLSQNLCKRTTMSSPVHEKIRCLMSITNATIFPRADVAGPGLSGIAIAFTPVFDGDFLPRESTEMLRSGDFHKIPVLIGTTKDEGSLFLTMTTKGFETLPTPYNPMGGTVNDKLNMTHYKTLIEDSFKLFMSGIWNMTPLLLQAVELQYWPQKHNGPAGYPTGLELAVSASDVIGDLALLCSTLDWTHEASKYSNVYAYTLTQRTAADPFSDWMGVVHGVELDYVYAMAFWPGNEDAGYSQDDKKLSYIMMTYWANFIKYGDPNRDGGVAVKNGIRLPNWPTHKGDSCPARYLEASVPKLIQGTNDTEAIVCGLKAGDCEFWVDYMPQYLRLAAAAGPQKPPGGHPGGRPGGHPGGRPFEDWWW